MAEIKMAYCIWPTLKVSVFIQGLDFAVLMIWVDQMPGTVPELM